MSAHLEQRNQDATVYCGNLDDRVTEDLLWELMIQIGPVVNVHMPKDKVTLVTQGYGFVEFRTEASADYCVKVMNMVKLYEKPMRVNKASQDRKSREIGANLFIGNLDPEVDEKLLYDTFSAFGGITSTPKVMRDDETGNSKGFGFVNFDSFEAADLAIECMSGQFLCNRSIVVQYAFKKDSKGERHGSQAERLLAANNPDRLKPHTMFSADRPSLANSTAAPPMPGMPPMPPLPRGMGAMPPPPPGGFGGPPGMPPLPPRAPAPVRPAYGAPALPPNMSQMPRPPPPGGLGQQPPMPPRGLGMMGMPPPPPGSFAGMPPSPMGMPMAPPPPMGMGMPPRGMPGFPAQGLAPPGYPGQRT